MTPTYPDAAQADVFPRQHGIVHLVSSPGHALTAIALIQPGDRLVFLNEGITALALEAVQQALSVLVHTCAADIRVGAIGEHAALFSIPLPPCTTSLGFVDLVEWVTCCRGAVTWC